MSTEQKPQPPAPSAHHREHPQTTALGVTLISGWDKFKQGKLIGYKWMALILIVGAIVGVSWYIFSERSHLQSQLWAELETANTLNSLEKFSEAHANTKVGLAADMDRARVLMGPEGLEKIPAARDEGVRKQAIANVEAARALMTKLADQFNDDPIAKLECLKAMAESEKAFMGIQKPDAPSESLGSSEKLLEWLDKVSAAGEGTPWGDDAKKFAAELRSDPKVKEQLISVQRGVYGMTRPLDPGAGLGPLAPGGPFGPRPDGFPGIPGLPGLNGLNTPIPPVTPPSLTPMPTPKAPETPKPPETKGTEPTPKAPMKEATPKAPEKKTEPKAPEQPKPPVKAPEPKAKPTTKQ
jgi:hypothetical protein